MAPILGRYGPFFLYSYTVVMGLGLAAGLGLTAWQARRHSGRWPRWFDGLLVAVAFGLVGGRAGFVAANWEYYRQEHLEAWLVWQGGLSYHGALIAALLALWLWRQQGLVKVPLSGYLDLFAPALVLGSAFGWAACWLESCAYGRETSLGPLAADLPDNYGVHAVRYQTQLAGLLLTLPLLPVAWRLRARLHPGRLFWLTLLLLSLARLLITFLRGDAVPMLGPYRLDTLADAAFVLLSLLNLTLTLRSNSALGTQPYEP